MKSKLTVELIGKSFERIMSGTRRKFPTYLEISKDLGISVKTIHNFIEKNKEILILCMTNLLDLGKVGFLGM